MKPTQQGPVEPPPSFTNVGKEIEYNKDSLPEVKSIETIDEPIDLIEHTKGWFIAMGRTRLSEDFQTREQAEAFINTTKFLINLIIVLIQQCNEINKADIKQITKKSN